MEAYCVKCRAKKDMKSPKSITCLVYSLSSLGGGTRFFTQIQALRRQSVQYR